MQTSTTHGLSRPLKALAAVCVALILIVGSVTSLGWMGTSKWERYADTLRAAGQPLTFAEIEAQRSAVPEERNSALFLERLFPKFAELKGNYTGDPKVLVFEYGTNQVQFHEGIPRYTVQPSRQFLSPYRPLLDELNALRGMPAGRFRVSFAGNPVYSELPHLAPLRTASKVVSLDAMLRLVDGDLLGAAQDAELQFCLANTLLEEPFVISRLVQISIEAQGVGAIENLLRVGPIDAAALQRLTHVVQFQRSSASMKWALWGERASWIETCDRAAGGKVSLSAIAAVSAGAGGSAPAIPSMLPRFLVRSNQLKGAEMYTSLVDAADDPRELLSAARRIENEVPQLPRTQMLVRIMMPSLSRAVILHMRVAAGLECARAALAAEAFRMRTGRLPDSLPELVPADLPAVPADPFDGQPLRLVVTEHGIVIYSVGENLTDEGGNVVRDPQTKRFPDVGFRLLTPEHRGVPLTDDPPPPDD